MSNNAAPLWELSLSDFRDTVAREPMPGCGAVAVVSADLGLALVLKGLHLSQHHDATAPRQALIDKGAALKQQLAPLAQEDVAAFEAFMAAVGRDKEDEGRHDAIHAAAQTAGSRLIHAALHSVLLNVDANAGQLGSDTARDRARLSRDGLAKRADTLLTAITDSAAGRGPGSGV